MSHDPGTDVNKVHNNRRHRIVHLCLAAFYIDGYSYQENLLTKYHSHQGHDVSIVASLVSFDDTGRPTLLERPSQYVNEHGIPVARLQYAWGVLGRRLRIYRGTYRSLELLAPDIVFVHGPQFTDAFKVAMYAWFHKDVTVLVDNHADFNNSARNALSRRILHGVLWRACASVLHWRKAFFFGVLPARVDFLHDVYGVPRDRIDFLPMGADDDLVEVSRGRSGSTRRRLGISDTDFLIVSGGKFSKAKAETLELMKAVRQLNNVRLVIFGAVTPDLNDRFHELVDGHVVQHVGWLTPEASSDVFAAADLVVFPGGHSVFWEQVVALGVPIMVRRWPGMEHVDHSGNCVFLEDADASEIRSKVSELLESPSTYDRLLRAASSSERKRLLYSFIAARALDPVPGS